MSLPLTLCPACGYVLDDATGLTTGGRPQLGDVGICLSCGAVLIYGADGRPDREATPSQRALYSTPVMEAAIESILRRGPLPNRRVSR